MSITSERQRRLDPVNGGFIYYTLFHADKDERPDFAEVGDIIEEFGEGGKTYKCALNAKGQKTWTEDATWDRQTGGSGGGSAYTLPTASADTKGGVKIGSGLTMTGEVLSATGGGAEKFVVTLTQENDTWTADETIADIVAADAAGQIVFAVREEHEPLGIDTIIPLVSAVSGDSGGVIFCGVADTDIEKYIVSAFGIKEGSDVWQVTTTPIPTSSNAPLIVTMTEDQQNSGTYVGDKTFADARTAHAQGRNVVIILGDSSSSVLSVAPDGSRVALYFAAADTISTLSGNPTDNITITMN